MGEFQFAALRVGAQCESTAGTQVLLTNGTALLMWRPAGTWPSSIDVIVPSTVSRRVPASSKGWVYFTSRGTDVQRFHLSSRKTQLVLKAEDVWDNLVVDEVRGRLYWISINALTNPLYDEISECDPDNCEKTLRVHTLPQPPPGGGMGTEVTIKGMFVWGNRILVVSRQIIKDGGRPLLFHNAYDIDAGIAPVNLSSWVDPAPRSFAVAPLFDGNGRYWWATTTTVYTDEGNAVAKTTGVSATAVDPISKSVLWINGSSISTFRADATITVMPTAPFSFLGMSVVPMCGPQCGNGLCEKSLGESSWMCPTDCCPPGRARTSRTDLFCTRCPAGTYAPADTTVPCSAMACPAGTFDHDNDPTTECMTCLKSVVLQPPVAGSCRHCLAGTSDADWNASTPCVPCPLGSFAPEGTRGPCALCVAPKIDHDSDPKTECRECPPGAFVNASGLSGSCETYQCPSGTTDDDNDTTTPCVECPGHVTPRGSTGYCGLHQCVAGWSGQRRGREGIVCELCGPGTYVPSAGSMGKCQEHNCPAGKTDHDNDTSTDCIPCGPGHYVPSGSCGPCSAYVCPAGWVDDDSSESTECVQCRGPGLYVRRGMTGRCDDERFKCPAGWADEDRDSSTPCAKCAPGQFAAKGWAFPCNASLCPAGTTDGDRNPATACTEDDGNARKVGLAVGIPIGLLILAAFVAVVAVTAVIVWPRDQHESPAPSPNTVELSPVETEHNNCSMQLASVARVDSQDLSASAAASSATPVVPLSLWDMGCDTCKGGHSMGLPSCACMCHGHQSYADAFPLADPRPPTGQSGTATESVAESSSSSSSSSSYTSMSEVAPKELRVSPPSHSVPARQRRLSQGQTLFHAPLDPVVDPPPVIALLCAHLRKHVERSPSLFAPADPAAASAAADLFIAKYRDIPALAQADLDAELRDPCAAGEVLRAYLASLPEPLLSHALYDSFVVAAGFAAPDRAVVCRLLVAHLNRGYRSAVSHVLSLLHAALAAGAGLRALASAFASVLLRPAEQLFYMKDDAGVVLGTVEFLISEFDAVWSSTGARRLAAGQSASDPSLPLPSPHVPQALHQTCLPDGSAGEHSRKSSTMVLSVQRAKFHHKASLSDESTAIVGSAPLASSCASPLADRRRRESQRGWVDGTTPEQQSPQQQQLPLQQSPLQESSAVSLPV
eukprot:m51a1_g11752 putative protein (1175) ;mRNA; r:193755-198658